MKQNPTYGIWFTYPEELSLKWIGDAPAPMSGLRLRLWIAFHYIRSKGKGGRFMELIRYSMKALAFCLNPSHTSVSGNPITTAGLSMEDIAEEWTNFSVTACVPPQSGQGNDDTISDNLSNCD